eukprot:TRINITY_DN9236_c0_g1_i3.p1 TRINITY_DN9236_c0_g1~~TRINITY_DN9236_c0_g1_i3.p1  ORF type:complete len:190 (-),score=14.62 TRINITY_DN9236_c0_g1_i3:141-710(-)
MKAAIGGNFQTVLTLISLGADPLFVTKRGGILHWAHRQAHLLDKFVGLGCKLDEQSESGKTPLFRAAEAANADGCMKFIELGSDVFLAPGVLVYLSRSVHIFLPLGNEPGDLSPLQVIFIRFSDPKTKIALAVKASLVDAWKKARWVSEGASCRDSYFRFLPRDIRNIIQAVFYSFDRYEHTIRLYTSL